MCLCILQIPCYGPVSFLGTLYVLFCSAGLEKLGSFGVRRVFLLSGTGHPREGSGASSQSAQRLAPPPSTVPTATRPDVAAPGPDVHCDTSERGPQPTEVRLP